ncbi:hypothetical protein ABG067_003895 [Albugo candida]|uniref:Band 7 domain-containing protein n=1 Tax=Albugo candida TaxID=65357 RepID=A0A024GRE0_9STRA|nr:unnamed protein product [Albugo candida]|eukprot:CCI49448.1 unnamed protein product [Albugo candida]
MTKRDVLPSGSFQVPAEGTEIPKCAFSKVEGKVVSEMLDVRQKELIIEEGARRQLEVLARDRRDHMFCFVTKVHQSTADDYLDNIVEHAVEELSHRNLVIQSIVMTNVIEPILSKVEEKLRGFGCEDLF